MGHFAEIDNDNTVLRVIVTPDYIETDSEGTCFCNQLVGSNNKWLKTSYNGNIRYNYAGHGMRYDEVNDAFIPQKPYNSWILNDNFKWEAPITQTDPNTIWDEDTLSWVLLN